VPRDCVASSQKLVYRSSTELQHAFVLVVFLLTTREMSLKQRYFKSDMKLVRTVMVAATLVSLPLLSGCTTNQVLNGGFVADDQTLALAPVGSSREQVLLSLGSPSATATFDNEVFYYISQKRSRPVAFMKPKVIDQSVMAVYFDKDGVVENITRYGLKDGKVFDMISRTTPTGGRDLSFLEQLLKGGTDAKSLGANIFGSAGQ
jgi:outer membrane protein assembly factor BamE (lipoprotein component of BamABCDE complex)